MSQKIFFLKNVTASVTITTILITFLKYTQIHLCQIQLSFNCFPLFEHFFDSILYICKFFFYVFLSRLFFSKFAVQPHLMSGSPCSSLIKRGLYLSVFPILHEMTLVVDSSSLLCCFFIFFFIFNKL